MTAGNSRLRSLLAATAAAGALLLPAAAAFARGGGGGGFGGGGGGSGGGGGGDGDGGLLVWLLFHLLELCIRVPAVGIPLTVVVLLLLVKAARGGRRSWQGRVIRHGREALRGERRARALETLRASDPDFDEAAFLGRVKGAFHRVQEAWCAHDLAPLRPFVSDGIHERFTIQIAEQRELGIRDRMEDVRVLDAEFAEVVARGPFDAVAVRIRATAVDYRVALEGGAFLSGSRAPREFTEFWTFLRVRGARTRGGGKGLMEGCCPSCGAALEINQWAPCGSCGAVLRSGQFDWVLTEITQTTVWEGDAGRTPPGLEEFRARDPAFNLPHVEDRASVMFWRLAEAERRGSADPLLRVATPALVEARRRELPPAGAVRTWWGDRSVGSAETISLETRDGRDRAVVAIRWRGTRFTAAPGKRPEAGERGSIVTRVLLLERNAGVATDASATVSASHCPSCGAPDPGPEKGGAGCPWCGAARNDGARDWVLAAAPEPGSAESRSLLASAVFSAEEVRERPPEATLRATLDRAPPAVLDWMVAVARADGALDGKEREGLLRLAAKAGPGDRAPGRLESDAAGELPDPPRGIEAIPWLEAAAAMALADGRLRGPEVKVLRRLGERAGFVRADVDAAVHRVRRRLYEEARETLRRN